MPGGRFRKINEMYKMASPRHRVMGQWFISAWTLKSLSRRPLCFVCRIINGMYRAASYDNFCNVRTPRFIWELPPGAQPVQGRNTVSVAMDAQEPGVAANVVVSLADVELEIKYLLGQSFHLYAGDDTDPDLGPHRARM